MAEKIKHHDFVELDYTGQLPDGGVFDTTQEAVAKEHGIFSETVQFKPAVICVGEKQVLPGLDKALEGKEVNEEFEVTLPPEEAFGKRDVKRIRIVPISTFREHKVQPQPGLQIDVDGERGTVTRVAGGRVIVNFNHPLAGKAVHYKVKVLRKITDVSEQVKSFLNATLRIPLDKMTVEVKEGVATVVLPMELPEQFTTALAEKLAEITVLKNLNFTVKTAGK